MYRTEGTLARENKYTRRHEYHHQSPSFSSTLLDEILRSIDESDRNNTSSRSYQETMPKKQSRDFSVEIFSKSHKYHYDFDRDVMFFSSASNSSDSSSGCLSSSDTESLYGPTHCSKTTGFNKTEKRNVLFRSVCQTRPVYEYVPNSAPEEAPRLEQIATKSTSKASKIYSKVKQPMSPGKKLASFLNSLFTSGLNKPKPKLPRRESTSAPLSASSFSRSCLNKNPHSTRGRVKSGNGSNQTIQLCPVSIIVDENSRPRGQKCTYPRHEDLTASTPMSVALPTEWKIGKSKSPVSPSSNNRKVEELLNAYRQSQNKTHISTGLSKTGDNYDVDYGYGDHEDDEDDDAASCSSSELFELDVIRNNSRYNEELPVYGTTRIDTNLAIANGLIV